MIDYPEGKPCWAPGAAEYLESLLTGEEIGWEWGGGASSVWLAPKVKFLHVMESSEKWYEFVFTRTASDECHVYLFPTNEVSYIHYYATMKVEPTLWLIDGYRRIDCLAVVRRFVDAGDIVVMDDALDYAEFLFGKVSGEIKRFAQPHPHAGIPINHKKYGHLRNTVRNVHADTKETWVWRV